MKHGFRPRRTSTPAAVCVGAYDGYWQDYCDEEDGYEDRDYCERCGGEGFIEYSEAGPDVWGEDCPSEVNHLVDCPDCAGTGVSR